MAYGALVAYRNLVWSGVIDTATFSTGAWEPDAPVTNLSTPQLGEIARFVAVGALGTDLFAGVDVDLAEASTVGIVGFLNVTTENVLGYKLRLFDSADAQIGSDITVTSVEYPDQDYFPRNIWHIFGTPVPGVKRVEVELFLGNLGGATVDIGGLWIGPAWRLDAMPGDWAMQVTENRVSTESDGNQTRADPQRRYRILTFRMNLLTEREALGVQPSSSDAVSLENSLMDLYFHSGLSLPIVVMPRISDPARIHALGVYGYMQPPLVIAPNSAPDDPASGAYASSRDIVVRESL